MRAALTAARLLAPLAALTLACAAPARTIHVPGEYLTIQAGITAAVAGDTVLVGDGTYPEHDIAMKTGVVVESDAGDPSYVTVDAQGLGRCFICDGVTSGEIDALTLTGGVAPGTGLDGKGGGMVCLDSSLRIEDVTFDGNTCSLEGGALYCEGGDPHIVSCDFEGNSSAGAGGAVALRATGSEIGTGIFTDNTALRGGALALFDAATTTLVLGCWFNENTALFEGGSRARPVPSGLGGAIYLDTSVAVEIRSCEFYGNTAEHAGGGVYVGSGCAPQLNFCRFILNDAAYYGGGLCAEGAISLGMEGWGVADDLFRDNTAWHGGAFYAYTTDDVDISEYVFRGNFAAERGGAIALEDCTDASITQCELTRNKSSRGFALDVIGCSGLNLKTCTVAANEAKFGATGAGPIYFGESSEWIDIEDAVIALNDGEAIECGASVVPDWQDPTVLDLDCTDIWGNKSGDWSGAIASFEPGTVYGNMHEDPLFCDFDGSDGFEHDDFTLCSNSPCLSGDPLNLCQHHLGALPPGTCGECDSPVEAKSWGSIKGLYR